MMPIAQTFLVTEPTTGVDAYFLTSIDLFFQSKSTQFGIEVQIRETDNGVPTSNTLPYASKILQPSSVNTSADGSVATNFQFDTPVVIQTNQQYAIVVVPVGGNPNYTIWTGVNGGTDTVTKTPIYTSNQLGSLFISTNDLNFTAVQSESMKYNLYIAQYTGLSGTAGFVNGNTDMFNATSIIGSFYPGERVVLANNIMSIASITTSGSNTLSVGEVAYQPNTGTLAQSTANGVVAFANTTLVLLSNVQGSFTTSTAIKGNTTSYLISPSVVSQNVSTIDGSNLVSVPSSNSTVFTDFTIGNFIYVGTNNRGQIQTATITAAPNSTTLQLSSNVSFTSSASIYGRVRADGNLYGYFTTLASPTAGAVTSGVLALGDVSSNTAANFTNSANLYLIGVYSGASAIASNPVDYTYDSITTNFAYIAPKNTGESFRFQGLSNTYSTDSGSTTVAPGVPYEFIDTPRTIRSRSNEIVSSSGASSLTVYTDMSSTNTAITPYIDKVRNKVTLTHNLIFDDNHLSGCYVSCNNVVGSFAVGDTVWQANSTVNTSATVDHVSANTLLLIDIVSSNNKSIATFNANGSSIITDSTSGATANVTSVSYFSEDSGTGLVKKASRYISRSVQLASGQDADDLQCYIDAYFPPGTNIHVYGKGLASSDGDSFNNKAWSIMPMTSAPGNYSSLVNLNNIVELQYELPSSQQIFSSGATCNTGNTIVNVPLTGSTSSIIPGEFVYIADQGYSITSATVSAAGSGYTNSTIVMLTGTAGYENSNATFSVVTNSSGNVVSVSPISIGSYLSNAAITSNSTSNTSGTGSGLTLSISGTQFNQSTLFSVVQVAAVPNTSAFVTTSNVAFTSGNAALGVIPNLGIASGMFKYDQNNYIARYVTSTGSVYDTFLTFAIKIVLTANSSNIVPRLSNMRALALQT